MLVRFKPVVNIFDEIDTIINSTVAPVTGLHNASTSGRFGTISMKDNGDQVHVAVEIPGIPKNEINVNINENVLKITTERKMPELKENEKWIRNEISYGKYERSIRLPYAIEADRVSANHENGVLSIVLPKHENAKPKQISIR